MQYCKRTILFINNRKKKFKTPRSKCDLFFLSRPLYSNFMQTRPKLPLSTAINQIARASCNPTATSPRTARYYIPPKVIILLFSPPNVHSVYNIFIYLLGGEKYFSCRNQYRCSSTTISHNGKYLQKIISHQ